MTLSRIITAIRMEGFSNVVSIWIVKEIVARYERKDMAFDRMYKVDTSGLIHTKKQQFVGANREHAVYYYPSSLASMSSMFSYLVKLEQRLEQFVFVDLGCGKGKPLFVASDYPFKAIVGVEASLDTAAVASKNITAYKSSKKKCSNITVTVDDILNYQFPDEHLVIYLGNPFIPNSPMYDTLLVRLKNAAIEYNKQIYIMYYCPDSHAQFDSCAFLRKEKHYKSVFDSHDWAIYKLTEQI